MECDFDHSALWNRDYVYNPSEVYSSSETERRL